MKAKVVKEVSLQNSKARFNYEFLDTYETGVELFGYEVKAVKSGRAMFEGSHAIVRGGEVWVIGLQIPPYQAGNTPPTYDPARTRRLLLHKKQIHEIERTLESKGLTIVPVSLYSKGGRIKMQIAVAKGKKEFDKRRSIKKRDTDRDIRREMSTKSR